MNVPIDELSDLRPVKMTKLINTDERVHTQGQCKVKQQCGANA